MRLRLRNLSTTVFAAALVLWLAACGGWSDTRDAEGEPGAGGDATSYFDAGDTLAGLLEPWHGDLDGMVERRMRESIITIGSFWYSAWVEAGQPDLDIPIDPEVLEEIENRSLSALFTLLDIDEIADVIEEMPSDEAADVIGELEHDDVTERHAGDLRGAGSISGTDRGWCSRKSHRRCRHGNPYLDPGGLR